MNTDANREESCQILDAWIASCTRGKKVSRNTVAVGIVVLDQLRKTCPVLKEDVISPGGKVKGARSGLRNTLEAYGIPASYLHEVTTRQGHQDGQRLFEQFGWGNKLITLSIAERDLLLQELIDVLLNYATDWLKRQNLKLDLDRRHTPSVWVHTIVENAKSRSGGVVEQHLIGAILERRFQRLVIPNHPAHANARQASEAGDFRIGKLVYHIPTAPSQNVIQKCVENLRIGLHPVLLVSAEQENKARVLAQDGGIDKKLSIISIETLVAFNIIEFATDENKDFFGVLKEIVEIYNRRIAAVESDLSLQIQV